MIYNYIYIDDTFGQIEEGTINGIQNGNLISVDFLTPDSWENLLDNLLPRLTECHGLLLDLRLNGNPYKDNLFAKFKGSTLAQELRTLIKEGVIIADFPIILISGDDVIESSLDSSSIDLFDAIISKNNFSEIDSYPNFRNLLVSLAKGYISLNTEELTIENILKISDQGILDVRFCDTLSDLLRESKHKIARFIIKMVLEKPTFLIDESYLSARLGVKKDSPDWSKLLGLLSETKYEGVFGEYYDRWWMASVESWWGNKISDNVSLRRSSAQQRVELLKSKLNLDLVALNKTPKSKSEAFWTICTGTKQAIDTMDGFIIANQDDNYPWQEIEYISIDEALRPKEKAKWKEVSIGERLRLENLKQFYAKLEQRPGKQ